MTTVSKEVSAQYLAVRRRNVHRHAGTLEILWLLRGSLDVRVSCERFQLLPGDYAVLNAGDPHELSGSKDCLLVELHLKIADFLDEVPHLDGVIFACESFDLPRFVGRERELRELIWGVVESPVELRADRAAELLRELASSFSFEDYYDRRTPVSSERRMQFRMIVSQMKTWLSERDAQDRVAAAMHYQKASLSRIVRGASAVSFSDLLTYLRVAAAEIMLIDTDLTVSHISQDCGFSDVKYLTRAFGAWFGESPAAYRRAVQSQSVLRESVETRTEEGRQLASRIIEQDAADSASSRLSFTPLLMKNVGTDADLLAVPDPSESGAEHRSQGDSHRVPHLFPLNASGGSAGTLSVVDMVQGIDRTRYEPVVLLPVQDPEVCERAVSALGDSDIQDLLLWIPYAAGQQRAAESLARQLHERHSVVAIPIRTA